MEGHEHPRDVHPRRSSQRAAQAPGCRLYSVSRTSSSAARLGGCREGPELCTVCTGGTAARAASHSPPSSRPRRALPSELRVSISALCSTALQAGKSTTFSWASFGMETRTEALKLRVKKTAMPKESFPSLETKPSRRAAVERDLSRYFAD